MKEEIKGSFLGPNLYDIRREDIIDLVGRYLSRNGIPTSDRVYDVRLWSPAGSRRKWYINISYIIANAFVEYLLDPATFGVLGISVVELNDSNASYFRRKLASMGGVLVGDDTVGGPEHEERAVVFNNSDALQWLNERDLLETKFWYNLDIIKF